MRAVKAGMWSWMLLLTWAWWAAPDAWGRASFEPVPTSQPQPGPTHDWPRFTLSAGALYAPAPRLTFVVDERTTNRQLLDQAGAQLALDWMFTPDLLVGLEVTPLANRDGNLVEAALRFGGLWPINDQVAIHGRLTGGFSYWGATKGGRSIAYAGPQLGLVVGIRVLLISWLGVYAETGGTAALYKQTTGPQEEWDWYPRETELLRLHLETGIMLGF